MTEVYNANLEITQSQYGFVSGRVAKLRNLISQGWRATYSELFGQSFVDSMDSAETDDKHHSEAIEWHWNARIALLEGRRPPEDEFAYFPIWARGHMKTTLAEHMVCIDAVLSYAYGERGFCLYIGREKDKVTLNISNIEALFGLPQVVKYAPGLSQVSHDKDTNQQGRWTAFLIQTQTNYTVKAATVESAQAGAKIKDTRVTFFVPDDIDDRDESPVQAETKYRKLTGEILPMRQENTLTFFAQNLINRFSTMYRIYKGQSLALANRKLTKPIPAVRGLVTERVTLPNGKIQDKMIAGKSTWRGWNNQRIQDEIDTSTLPVFLTEMQHEVEQSKEGLILYNYDDNVHVISESEFNSVFGKDAWKYWRKKPGNDWARTKTDKHANVAGWLTISSQNTPLPNCTFLIHPMSFPANAAPEDVAERLLSSLSPFIPKISDTDHAGYYKTYEQITWQQLRIDILNKSNVSFHAQTVEERIRFERGELERVVPRYASPLLQKFNVQAGQMSHEQDTVRKIYSSIYSLVMNPTNPKKHGGVELINREMRVDYNQPHPFRPDQKGFTKWFMIAPDDKTKQYRTVNGEPVYLPRPYPETLTSAELADSDLARYQFRNWRYAEPKLTETGEKIDEPLKLLDDFGNLLQMWAVGGQLSALPLDERETIEAAMPDALKTHNMRQASPYPKGFTAGQEGAWREEVARVKKQLGIDQVYEDTLFEQGGF